MRHVGGMALVVASLALGGCVNSTFDSLSSLQNGCSTSTTSVACTSPTPVVTPPTTPPTSPSGAPIVNTGNTTNITTGDTTIALESSVNTTTGASPAISKLLNSPLTIGNTSTANQQIWFNTNTSTNGLWPVSKTMTYSDYGTCQTESPYSYTSPTQHSYVTPAQLYTINSGPIQTNNNVDPANPGACLSGTGATALGGHYRLYRYYQPGSYDEELQVWTWNQSYATQYRDITASGTDPQHQAWSFGGNYTTAANMPIGGSVNYAGQWTATAKTKNYVDTTGSTTVPLLDSSGNVVFVNGAAQTTTIAQSIAKNNDWRVNGTTALTADFGANTLKGTLTSTNWQAVDKNIAYDDVDPKAARDYSIACAAGNAAICNTTTIAGQNGLQNLYNYEGEFMNTNVVLNGTITKSTTNTAKPNQVVGTAAMDLNNGWITDSTTNPMFAGFFGPVTAGKPQEVTGAFALSATMPMPNAGNAGINNDRAHYIEMSGIFNGQ